MEMQRLEIVRIEHHRYKDGSRKWVMVIENQDGAEFEHRITAQVAKLLIRQGRYVELYTDSLSKWEPEYRRPNRLISNRRD